MSRTLTLTLHLFCRVVDNFGDIGVCWRLARQLSSEHGMGVTLWVDDLASFKKICGEIDAQAASQSAQGVNIRRWPDDAATFSATETGAIVIEAFGCELPFAYVRAMAERVVKPVWINLEYLSAEEWVEGCHGLPSPHASLPLTKYFFFPGFAGKTGGLLAEQGLDLHRAAFQNDAQAVAAFFASLGVPQPAPDALKVSLFCYPQAPLTELFGLLQVDVDHPLVCFVAEGVASDAVAAFLQAPAVAGASRTCGGLTLQVLPFLAQADYDRLLWSCDLNFVRGEDSFVRAQWAQRPFVWHIYPQQEEAHLLKLDAFLARYTADIEGEAAQSLSDFWRGWNGVVSAPIDWPCLRTALPKLQAHLPEWTAGLRKNADLASNLVQFIKKIS